jgi:hypothetical protein
MRDARRLRIAPLPAFGDAPEPVTTWAGGLGDFPGEQAPHPRHAFEFVLASICELEAGTRHEIGYRARDQDLTRLRQCSDPRSDMDSDSAKVSASPHAFTRVHTRTQLDTEWSNRFGRGHRAFHRQSWAVERGEETVSSCLDPLATEPVELATHDLVMVAEKVTPALVTEVSRSSRRFDNVGEENGGQDPVGIGRGSMPGQEFLDVVEGPRLAFARRSGDPRSVVRHNAHRRYSRRGTDGAPPISPNHRCYAPRA